MNSPEHVAAPQTRSRRLHRALHSAAGALLRVHRYRVARARMLHEVLAAARTAARKSTPR